MSDFPKYTGYSGSFTVSYGVSSNAPQYRPLGHWCFKSNSPRLDAGCLHCVWSMKIGASWLCFYPRKVVDA